MFLYFLIRPEADFLRVRKCVDARSGNDFFLDFFPVFGIKKICMVIEKIVSKEKCYVFLVLVGLVLFCFCGYTHDACGAHMRLQMMKF